VVKGKSDIGNGGSDLVVYADFVTAYDAMTGKESWRFYTVPGDPSKPF
jgi:quinohemoprotein ethanol dehydrogenase